MLAEEMSVWEERWKKKSGMRGKSRKRRCL
jgi:hypothetical protein